MINSQLLSVLKIFLLLVIIFILIKQHNFEGFNPVIVPPIPPDDTTIDHPDATHPTLPADITPAHVHDIYPTYRIPYKLVDCPHGKNYTVKQISTGRIIGYTLHYDHHTGKCKLLHDTKIIYH